MFVVGRKGAASSVAAHDDTLMRMAVRPCQTVTPAQHAPSVWMSWMICCVAAGLPKLTSAWFNTVSFSTS